MSGQGIFAFLLFVGITAGFTPLIVRDAKRAVARRKVRVMFARINHEILRVGDAYRQLGAAAAKSAVQLQAFGTAMHETLEAMRTSPYPPSKHPKGEPRG